MHVEISVALNFVISYLYNKLPRRRVDLFVEELENEIKSKFEGHWYPDKPSKGSGFRCIKVNGEEMDQVIIAAAVKAGLDLEEVKSFLPEDLTLWIDPAEVSYKIGEKGPVKILFSNAKEEDNIADKTDREVQAASHIFNPDAQSFNPEVQPYNPVEAILYSPADLQALFTEPSQSFQPIDSVSSSLSNLSLSPSSPVPPGTWSTATSPSSTLFNSSPSPTANMPSTGFMNTRPGNGSTPQFTAASFAQTKFGSTKLKTNAKRPNRLSPTEFGNFFRQQQRSYAGPPRPRSLSPRDPRVEFLLDQQHRLIQQQQHQQQHQQQRKMSPSVPYQPQYPFQQQPQQPHHPQHHQHLCHTGMLPDYIQQQQQQPATTALSSSQSSPHLSPHPSPHLSPHVSPQGNGPTFQELISPTTCSINTNTTNNNNTNIHNNNMNNTLSPSSMAAGHARPNSFSHFGRSMGFPPASRLNGYSSYLQGHSSPISAQGPGVSQMNVLSPEGPKSFVEGLNTAPVNHSTSPQHLLMAN